MISRLCQKKFRVPVMAQWKRTRLVSMRMWVWALTLLSGQGIQWFRELRCRLQMRLGSQVTVAVAVEGMCRIWPLALELPYVTGVALKRRKRKKKCKRVSNYIFFVFISQFLDYILASTKKVTFNDVSKIYDSLKL